MKYFAASLLSRAMREASVANPYRRNPVAMMPLSRPHRSILVRVRIVGGMVCGQGADAPAAPHVRLHQPFDHPASAVGRDNSRPQTMSGIRRNAEHRFFVAIQGVGIEPRLLIPECFVEAAKQLCCFRPQLLRAT